ncbi:MAG: hypothetical protein MUF05_04735 [Candidatus Omnitrophica bacterium]|jgi:type II secretory pathway pseudopilin PulG|nr:hypothetical protein [Candidatus Omnitrophota bacterium]
MKNKGFTLVEVFISAGIMLLVVGTAYTIILTGNFSMNTQENEINAQNSAQLALFQIAQDLRLASGVKVWVSDGFGTTQGTPAVAYKVVNFQIPVGSFESAIALDSNNYISWGSERLSLSDDGTGNYIAYSLDNQGQIIRTVYSASGTVYTTKKTRIVARNISSLNFTRSLSENLLQIQITSNILASKQSAPIQKTVSTTVLLRNG